MEYRRKLKAMMPPVQHNYRWMLWLSPGVLALEVLVVALGGSLPTLIVLLSIDCFGALACLWGVRTRQQRMWRTSHGVRPEKEEVKNHNDDTDALELLRQVGFTRAELDQLCLLRRRYLAREKDRASADASRLKFVRWLVETGKLTDQL